MRDGALRADARYPESFIAFDFCIFPPVIGFDFCISIISLPGTCLLQKGRSMRCLHLD